MFKKSDKNIQGNLFSRIPSNLRENSLKLYKDTNGWYNQFHKQIALRIDESVFNSMDNEEIISSIKIMMQHPIEELHKRNNVEATIFNLYCKLRNGKSKYRKLEKNQTWAIYRCLWVNLINF